MKRLKLLLCDDHALMREGLATMLQNQDWIEIVGKVDNGIAAINFVGEIETDIVLMDIVMAGMSGLEATRWIKEQQPSVKVILVSGEATPASITSGIKIGADAYILKHSSENLLLEAIRAVSRGESYFGLEVITLVAKEAAENISKELTCEPNCDTDKKFIQLVVAGSPMDQIEAKLSLPKQSGKEFFRNIMRQCGLKSMADVIHYSISHNIVKI